MVLQAGRILRGSRRVENKNRILKFQPHFLDQVNITRKTHELPAEYIGIDIPKTEQIIYWNSSFTLKFVEIDIKRSTKRL